ncbi:MAG: hypothetical protein AB1656_09440 [Candidatus Omnitrophota bacterium]
MDEDLAIEEISQKAMTLSESGYPGLKDARDFFILKILKILAILILTNNQRMVFTQS